MVNNVIVVLSLILISYLYLSKRLEASLVGLFTLCMIAPTLRIGEAYINAAYLITIWLAALFFIEAIKERAWPKLTRQDIKVLLILFIVSRIVSITAFIIGYLQNGTASWGVVTGALAGNLNLSILVVELTYMGQKLAKRRLLPLMYKSAAILALVNIVFFLLQRFSFDLGFSLTARLFESPDRSAPLEAMKEIGAFDRIFGSFFTPTVLGTTFLYLIVILAAWYIMTKQKQIMWPIITVIAVLTFIGINSFSKLIILGLPALAVFTLICLLFLRKSKKIRPISMRNFWLFFSATLAVFILTYYLFPAELINVKNYYYGLIIEPLSSLSTRYRPPAPVDPAIIDSGEAPIDAGLTVSALLFFRQYPIFGVGPVAIADEFIGDSQVVSALHHGGIVGAVGYLIFYVYAFIEGIKRRNLMVLTLLVSLAIGCLATVTLDYRHTMPFIAFIILAATDSDTAFGPNPDTHYLAWRGEERQLKGANKIEHDVAS